MSGWKETSFYGYMVKYRREDKKHGGSKIRRGKMLVVASTMQAAANIATAYLESSTEEDMYYGIMSIVLIKENAHIEEIASEADA